MVAEEGLWAKVSSPLAGGHGSGACTPQNSRPVDVHQRAGRHPLLFGWENGPSSPALDTQPVPGASSPCEGRETLAVVLELRAPDPPPPPLTSFAEGRTRPQAPACPLAEAIPWWPGQEEVPASISCTSRALIINPS